MSDVAAWVVPISTFVLVVLTGYYAWTTRKISETADRQLRAAAQPMLLPLKVTTVPQAGWPRELALTVGNVGMGPALSVVGRLMLGSSVIDSPADGERRDPWLALRVGEERVIRFVLRPGAGEAPEMRGEFTIDYVDIRAETHVLVAPIRWDPRLSEVVPDLSVVVSTPAGGPGRDRP